MLQEARPTIHFTAELFRPDQGNAARAKEKSGLLTFLSLPRNASAGLRDTTTVEGILNAFPFRAPLEPDGKGTHSLKITKALRAAAGVDAGDTVSVEITRFDEEPEVRVPPELTKALAGSPAAQKTWTETTPIARRDWILWITSGKQPETRLTRIEKACSMLASGKRRVCCFGGLNWLTKDHPTVETWLPLPNSKNRLSPRSTK